jgi:GTPase SAR1 family protein
VYYVFSWQDDLFRLQSSEFKVRRFFIMEDNPAYKVTVLGGEGVGKTALIIQFLSRTFIESVRNLALFLTLAYIFLA